MSKKLNTSGNVNTPSMFSLYPFYIIHSWAESSGGITEFSGKGKHYGTGQNHLVATVEIKDFSVPLTNYKSRTFQYH